MKKYIPIILFVTIGIMLAAGCTSDTDGNGVQEVKTTENLQTQEENTTQEHAAQPVKGSYENPANINETVVLTSSSNSYEISVSDVKRGEEANYIVKKENEFNENPATGYEYLLVKMKIVYTKGDGPVTLIGSDIKAFCDNAECTDSYAVLPNDYIEFGSGDVMPGGTKEGWVQYTVPQDKEVIMSYQPNLFDDSTAYISIGK